MKLCDAHCHLQDERIVPVRGDILHRARSAGVMVFVCCGTEEADWDAVAELSSTESEVIPQFGLHPWFAPDRSSEWLSSLHSLLLDFPKAGVGEAGLDQVISNRNDEEQVSVLKEQLKLAYDLKRPISLHCRRAWGTMLETLRLFGPSKSGLVFHSFSGSAELIPELVRLGGYFSFSGSITFSGNKRGRKALVTVPPDRLLIETDSPDLYPNITPGLCDSKGRPINEPVNLMYVLNTASDIIKIPVDQLASQVWANARQIFGFKKLLHGE